MGRLYLPRELLVQAGIEASDPQAVIGDARVDQVCRQLPRGRSTISRQPTACSVQTAWPPPGAASDGGVYGAVLRQMLIEAGAAAPAVRIGKLHLLYLVVRCSVLG